MKIGRFIKLGNGVYKSTQYPSSEEDPYAIAVAQYGRDAYLCGESVLGFLRLMPTSIDRIYVKIPRRLRRRLPEGYIVCTGECGYIPININGVMFVPDILLLVDYNSHNEKVDILMRNSMIFVWN